VAKRPFIMHEPLLGGSRIKATKSVLGIAQ